MNKGAINAATVTPEARQVVARIAGVLSIEYGPDNRRMVWWACRHEHADDDTALACAKAAQRQLRSGKFRHQLMGKPDKVRA